MEKGSALQFRLKQMYMAPVVADIMVRIRELAHCVCIDQTGCGRSPRQSSSRMHESRAETKLCHSSPAPTCYLEYTYQRVIITVAVCASAVFRLMVGEQTYKLIIGEERVHVLITPQWDLVEPAEAVFSIAFI